MNNKTLTTAIIVVAVGVVAALIYYYSNNDNLGSLPQISDGGAFVEPAEEETATGTEQEGVKKPAKAESPLTYQQVVEQYKNYRIQFNSRCIPTPTSVTYKSGTRVMFDNRSGEKHTVILDGKGYVIGPNGFIILPLSSKTLPHTIKVDCDTQYNAAQILLQK